ncbi:hypothetical protein MPTK1_7g13540 [Marchantia polymorpha subsp. ruderalis]|uniref:EGF-like calcium-binding domain-containing protein n=2 Tax=Marchantia polymorpha TaxID=3197 RepID=A0AAF6BZ78_MARPO|nr:hypothetical protein MARPO_0009s0040 [Marchantia polymorpha]BBN17312.1 hypothetical protein Mp_7g13540 [Marchantia polymorpha subsp. ruderalis]|eukprot:PTQ46917.1 hypothetical protein MARPO_0009s0040 [Marchantia polymorpha]
MEPREVRKALMMCAVVVVALGLSWAGAAQGKYVVEERGLNVLSPGSLEGKFDVAVSSFGRPGYAGSILGSLQYPKQGASGCTAFNKFSVSFKKSDSDYRHSPIALIESTGECDFAWRVYNAQLAGAAAVLIVDGKDEPLIKMADSAYASPPSSAKYVANITIPSALVNKTLGDLLRTELTTGSGQVNVKLEWGEAPTEPLIYEFWTISQDKCGANCDSQVEFVQSFRGVAQNLEKGGYTVFTPHYIVWFCPPKFTESKECKSQCLNNGRYCSPDPEDNFESGYEGKDVVTENLRQLCVHKLLLERKKPWVWWDYVADFHLRCSMKEGKYTHDCGDTVAGFLGLNATDIHACMGDPDADADNLLLKAEQDGQAGNGGERGDIVITPTLVISDKLYKGKLENGAVLKAMCSQFAEGTEPSLCMGHELQTNDCLDANGGCWADASGLVTACRDTFKGRVCECPYYQGVQFKGDGYQSCTPTGEYRCSINNAGCWQETRGNQTFSACSGDKPEGCECPAGFKGTGVDACENIDECKAKTKCQCSDCSCTDTWGSYDCQCAGDLIYLADNDACVRKTTLEEKGVLWFSFAVVGLAVVSLIVVAIIVYKYRVRSYMDSRIRATLAQYMPLDSSSQDIYRHLQEESG